MSNSAVYLPLVSSTESCNTSGTQVIKREMEVAITIEPYEGELWASSEDFDEDWQRRLLTCGVQAKIREKISRYRMSRLLRLSCFRGKIHLNNG